MQRTRVVILRSLSLKLNIHTINTQFEISLKVFSSDQSDKVGNKPLASDRQIEESRCKKMARPCRKNKKTISIESKQKNFALQITDYESNYLFNLDSSCRDHYHSVRMYTLLMWLLILCRCH